VKLLLVVHYLLLLFSPVQDLVLLRMMRMLGHSDYGRKQEIVCIYEEQDDDESPEELAHIE
jgi:hypothetical protein